MEQNIIEEVIVPEVPKVISNEQLYVYVPLASISAKGIAMYDGTQFDVTDGKVTLKDLFVKKTGLIAGDNISITQNGDIITISAMLGSSIYYTNQYLTATSTQIYASDIVISANKALQVNDFVLSYNLLFKVDDIANDIVTISLYADLKGVNGLPIYENDADTAPDIMTIRSADQSYFVDSLVYVVFAKPNSRLQQVGMYRVTLNNNTKILQPLNFLDGSQGVKGSQWYSGGNPNSILYALYNDYYLIISGSQNYTVGDVYRYTGSFWNRELSIVGTSGVGITSIEKTQSIANVDTYTITFSDDTVTMFTVTNGSVDMISSIVVNSGTLVVSVIDAGYAVSDTIKLTDTYGNDISLPISYSIPLSSGDGIQLSIINNQIAIAIQSSILEDVTASKSSIVAIESKIPSAASSTNQLADKNFVNSSINNLAAFYITKDSAGNAFETYAQLIATTVYYSGGIVRTPTRNDYCIVRADEMHDNSTTRYYYQNEQWEFQYIVNETALTSDQLATLNSGLTSSDKTQINTNKTDIANIKTNYAQKTGTYSGMTVGKASNADSATTANTAEKATADGNGNNIAATYLPKSSGLLKSVQAAKTDEMTTAVGVDNNGKLWAKTVAESLAGFQEDN